MTTFGKSVGLALEAICFWMRDQVESETRPDKCTLCMAGREPAGIISFWTQNVLATAPFVHWINLNTATASAFLISWLCRNFERRYTEIHFEIYIMRYFEYRYYHFSVQLILVQTSLNFHCYAQILAHWVIFFILKTYAFLWVNLLKLYVKLLFSSFRKVIHHYQWYLKLLKAWLLSIPTFPSAAQLF